MTESQQLLFDLCAPFWQRKSKSTGRAKALCQQDMLVWLSKQSGVGYKQFRDYSKMREFYFVLINTKIQM